MPLPNLEVVKSLEFTVLRGDLFTGPQTEPVMVDDWLDSMDAQPNTIGAYVHFMMHLFRLPATEAMLYRPIISRFRLFCTFKGNRYRVIGASRMGDIWLTQDYSKTTGYQHRVFLNQCTDYADHP